MDEGMKIRNRKIIKRVILPIAAEILSTVGRGGQGELEKIMEWGLERK